MVREVAMDGDTERSEPESNHANRLSMELDTAPAIEKWSTIVSRVRSSRFSWPVAYAGAFVAQAIVLLVAGQNQWYFFDEWRLIVERVVAPGDVSLFERLFRPDGEHVIAVPLALFIVLANIGGLGTYWPFVIANVVVRLATLWVADDVVRRLGGRRIVRLAVLFSIAFFGEGFESLFGQSLIFAGLTLLFSLLAIREAVRDDVSTRRAGIVATVFLVLAVFSTSYAFPVVLAVALFFAMTHRRFAGLACLLVPPAMFLLVRALAGGSYSQQQAISPRFVGLYIDYVQAGLATVGESITGLVGLGLASYVAIVAVCFWVAPSRRALVFIAAITLAVVAFFGQASLSRSALGAGQASAPRYVYFCGVLVIVMIGGAWAGKRVGPRMALIVSLALLVSLSNNIGRLRDGYDFYIPKMELSRERLGVGFAVQDQFPDFVPDPDWASDLRLERLDAVAAWSGSERLIEEGRSCRKSWIAELRDAGIDPTALTDQEQVSLILLLNEHALGYGVPGATFGDLLGFAASGGTGSSVLDQFAEQYSNLSAKFGQNLTIPALDACG